MIKEPRNLVDSPRQSGKAQEPVKKAWKTNSPTRKSPARGPTLQPMEDDVGYGILYPEPKRAKKHVTTSESSSTMQGSGSQGSSPKPATLTYSTNAKPGTEKKKYGPGESVPGTA